MENLIKQVELQAEAISISVVEVISEIEERVSEARTATNSSIKLQNKALNILCDDIDELISNTSQLVHRMQEIAMDREAVDRLNGQVLAINKLLDKIQ